MYPSLAEDQLRALRRIHRLSASPGTMAAMYQTLTSIDLRPVLPAIGVPTLV